MSDGVGRACRWCSRHADAVVAAALVAASAGILGTAGLLGSLSPLPASISALGFAALVVWRRRWPIPVAAVAGVFVAVPEFTPYANAIDNNDVLGIPLFVALFLYAYALGSGRPWRQSLLGLAPLTAGIVFAAGGGFNPLFETMTVGPWLGGLVVASRRRVSEQLERRARELKEERELFAVQSVRYERARIARELHDIVAHCVSLMVVQASAGAHLARRDPDSAAEAFESISEAARQAEAEIDRLVDLLDTSSLAAPPAGLRIIEELVGRVRSSGLDVSCQFSGDGDDLSEEAAEAAYRLVQEAVTNAMKHAHGAPIEVTVHGQVDTVEIRVVNQPATGVFSGLEATSGGHGLVGMRERVARCGGTFDAGPTGDEGWQVVARLPRRPRPDPASVSTRAVLWP
jgi:signal transduction histidine kinase